MDRIIARSKVGAFDYNVIIRYVEGESKPFRLEREYPEAKQVKDEIDRFPKLTRAFKAFEEVSGRKFTPAFKAMIYIAFGQNKL